MIIVVVEKQGSLLSSF